MDVTLLDGGMSREIVACGGTLRQPEWTALALRDEPDVVARAHRNFAAAGAEITTTANYAVVPFHLGAGWNARTAEALSDRAGRLARSAGTPLVAGCLPPPFGSYRPDAFDPAEAAAIHAPQVRGLAPHVDVWLAETISSVAEARAAAAAVAGGERPLWLSFTLLDATGRAPCLRSGEPVDDAVATARAVGADALLFNCSVPEVIGPAVAAAAGNGLRVGAYANAFVQAAEDGSRDGANETLSAMREDVTASRYADWAERWRDDGASIIGGCCGVGPAYIATMRERLAAGTT